MFQVLHVSVFVQSDGSLAASVKVPSMQDAQYAISQLHRRKVGFKRIMIAHAHSTSPQNPQYIKWDLCIRFVKFLTVWNMAIVFQCKIKTQRSQISMCSFISAIYDTSGSKCHRDLSFHRTIWFLKGLLIQ